jgi:hypothetical protein
MATYGNGPQRPRPAYADPRNSSTAYWIGAAVVALIAVGAIAWVSSDETVNPRSAQTQTDQPAAPTTKQN